MENRSDSRLRSPTSRLGLHVHFGPNFAPAAYFFRRPAGETGHDRQSAPGTAFRAERKGARHGMGASGIADTQGEPAIDELELQLDPIASAAPVTDRVRHELARHEQSVLHLLPADTLCAECAS